MPIDSDTSGEATFFPSNIIHRHLARAALQVVAPYPPAPRPCTLHHIAHTLTLLHFRASRAHVERAAPPSRAQDAAHDADRGSALRRGGGRLLPHALRARALCSRCCCPGCARGGSPFETRVWCGSPVACVDKDATAAEAGADGAALPCSRPQRAPVSRRSAQIRLVRARRLQVEACGMCSIMSRTCLCVGVQ